MARKTVPTLLCVGLAAGSLSLSAPEAFSAALPGTITSVSSRPGPGVGQVTINWQQNGASTTSFQVEAAASSFSPSSSSSLPRNGRQYKVFNVSNSLRSVTLSAAQVAAAGASVASGDMLYYRVYAINTAGDGTAVRRYPYLRAALPRPASPKSSGTPLRVGTFNVRTARATSDDRNWLTRAPDVAREILSRSPGIVAVQELGPGRADGVSGSTKGRLRQTTSLEQSLASAGGQRYQLVRESSYWAPNTAHGTQGTRILYDTSRYSLRSSCPETTGTSSWNASCTIKLPLRDTDSEEARRIAAYAQFADRKTGQRFYAVTAHLDERHSSNTTTEQSYNVLRGRQSAAIADAMTKINTDGLPVIVGGDFNSWQNNQVGNAGHEAFVTKGYYDTAAALTRVKLAYPTVNQFKLTVEPNSLGVGVRLDAIKVKGIQGATRTENVLLPVDPARPSDHSLVVSDLVL